MFKKNTITKIIAVLCVLLSLFSLASCSGDVVESDVPESVEEQIAQSELLYPERNEDFRYNKYTYYVAITQCLSTKSNIVIPDTIGNLPVYVIADNAFQNQATVKTITMSNNITQIGSSAFQNCSALTSVKLSSNLKEVGTSVFNNCTSLKEIEIPNSLSNITSNFCSNCTELTSIVIEEGELLSVDEETGAEVYSPERYVDDYAFSDCTSLCLVWVPEDVFFGDADDNSSQTNPFSGSLDNLKIYGYSQTSAARYAANNYVDFTLVQNKAQLAEFKSSAAVASKTVLIGADEEYEGTDLDVQIEKTFIFKDSFNYVVPYTLENSSEVSYRELTFTPNAGTEVAVFGVKVKNNTSYAISFDVLDASIKVDSYSGRFANFGYMRNGVMSKYMAPSYSSIPAGSVGYIYFATIVSSDWEEIAINFGNFKELINNEFIVKADNVTVISPTETAPAPEDENEEVAHGEDTPIPYQEGNETPAAENPEEKTSEENTEPFVPEENTSEVFFEDTETTAVSEVTTQFPQ